MSYIPTEWHDGDVVTAEKLNKIEDALANVTGGGLTIHWTINEDEGAIIADKTARQVIEAMQTTGMVFSVMPESYAHVIDPDESEHDEWVLNKVDNIQITTYEDFSGADDPFSSDDEFEGRFKFSINNVSNNPVFGTDVRADSLDGQLYKVMD